MSKGKIDRFDDLVWNLSDVDKSNLDVMKKTLLPYAVLFLSIVTLGACGKSNSPEPAQSDYVIFGHFYGECMGEECVELFKLQGPKVFEDVQDNYPGGQTHYIGKFVDLGPTKHMQAKDLMDYFPKRLLRESADRFGCPDCRDQGGLYIEYHFNGIHRSWMIDQFKGDVPPYLHHFMDQVNEKVRILRQ